MKRYNLYIRENQLEILETLAKGGDTVSEQIRNAIDIYIKRVQKKLFSESKSGRRLNNG